MEWQPVETAPYEAHVLTYWGGSEVLNPVILVNMKNDGSSFGNRDGWWYSRPTQVPTHWMPLPQPPAL